VGNLILGSGCQIEKFYIINNGTTAAKTVKNTTGTGIAVPAGKSMLVFNNGTNVVDVTTALTSLSIAGASTFGADSTYNGTGQIKFPAGTTVQRSGSPVDGMMRYNSDLDSFEGYVDGTWGGIGGAQAGGAIVTNKDIVSVNYTMPSGTNGMSVGPVTINSGISVTITTNQRWVIL
jgi:hypothetical protein